MDGYVFTAERPLQNYHKSDSAFLASVILLCGLGIFSLTVSSQNSALRMFGDQFYFVKRQLITFAIGIAGFVLFASIPMRVIRKMLPLIVIGTIILCCLTFVPSLSVERNGASRWIRMPFNFTLQPSEFSKFAVVLFLANLFDKQAALEDKNERSVMPSIIGLSVFVIIIFLQKDFSTGIFVFAVGIFMFLVTGMRISWILPFSPLAIIGVVFLIALEPYRMERIVGFLQPDLNVHTFNYQSIAARRAISSGGLFGNGIGGIEWSRRVPEVQADYIFSGWTEAMGLVGVLLYFAVLIFFTWRGCKASFSTQNRFAAFASLGCVAMIVLQSMINIAVVCGVLPVTGIPLPFFSLGGSSIIVTMVMCGFIFNTSRCDGDDVNYE